METDSPSSCCRPLQAEYGKVPSTFPGCLPISRLPPELPIAGNPHHATVPKPSVDAAMGSQPPLTFPPRRCGRLPETPSEKGQALYSRFGICREREDHVCRPRVGGQEVQGIRSMSPGEGRPRPQSERLGPLGPRAPATLAGLQAVGTRTLAEAML